MNNESNVTLVKTIELDCAPGSPRPWELIGGVVKDTVLEPLMKPEDYTPQAFFGMQVWDFSGRVDDDTWLEVKPVIKERVEALFHSGTIRYGSW